MADLYDSARERLRELGWKRLEVYGTVYWEHPVSRAWWREPLVFSELWQDEAKAERDRQAAEVT